MPLIDQRILIDAPTQTIWELISDPQQLASWHAEYVSVSVLTTQQTGLGTRRRCRLESGGKDVIEEITAWVEGMGYEYTLVEGGRFRAYQGRIRLQPGPDGTAVQWTFTYQSKGLAGALRNRLGSKRQIAAMMAESLRELRRKADAFGIRMDDDYRARVAMRDRLNADERAQYQRRHAPPPAVEPIEAQMLQVAPPPPDVLAPPPAPGLPAAPPTPEPVVPEVEPIPDGVVPSFVAGLAAELVAPDGEYTADTEPKAPPGLRESLVGERDEIPVPAEPLPVPAIQPVDEPPAAFREEVTDTLESPVEEPVGPADQPELTPQHALPAVEPPEVEPSLPLDMAASPEPLDGVDFPFKLGTEVVPPVEPDSAPPLEREPDVPKTEPAVPDHAVVPEHARVTPPHGIPAVSPPEEPSQAQPLAPVAPLSEGPAAPSPNQERPAQRPPQTPLTDTGEISIWEVFGVRPPSEQDSQALSELIQEVEDKQKMEEQRSAWASRRRVRVRARQAATGLRLRRTLADLRGTPGESDEDASQEKENGD